MSAIASAEQSTTCTGALAAARAATSWLLIPAAIPRSRAASMGPSTTTSRAGEAVRVVLEERACARVGVRRVDGDDAPPRVPQPRGRDGGLHLGRMVGVVVDDGDPVDLAADLEAARRPPERGARARRSLQRRAGVGGEQQGRRRR